MEETLKLAKNVQINIAHHYVTAKRQQLNSSMTDVMALRTKIQTFSRKQDFNIQSRFGRMEFNYGDVLNHQTPK
jgi:hypothetical protein